MKTPAFILASALLLSGCASTPTHAEEDLIGRIEYSCDTLIMNLWAKGTSEALREEGEKFSREWFDEEVSLKSQYLDSEIFEYDLYVGNEYQATAFCGTVNSKSVYSARFIEDIHVERLLNEYLVN